jgi:hypothetical protein
MTLINPEFLPYPATPQTMPARVLLDMQTNLGHSWVFAVLGIEQCDPGSARVGPEFAQ